MLSLPEYTRLCQVYPILQDLSANLQSLVQQEAQVKHARPGTCLFDVGDHCPAFLMVMEGSIRVSHPGSHGELLLYHVLPGENCIMTVSCLLGETVYQVRGIVENELLAATLPAESFRRLILASSEFRSATFRFFAERTLQLVDLVHEVAFERLDQRLARRLLAQGDHIVCTHQQLADDLGTVREVISRYLKEFNALGLVHLGRREILIVNRPALQVMAQSE